MKIILLCYISKRFFWISYEKMHTDRQKKIISEVSRSIYVSIFYLFLFCKIQVCAVAFIIVKYTYSLYKVLKMCFEKIRGVILPIETNNTYYET